MNMVTTLARSVVKTLGSDKYFVVVEMLVNVRQSAYTIRASR